MKTARLAHPTNNRRHLFYGPGIERFTPYSFGEAGGFETGILIILDSGHTANLCSLSRADRWRLRRALDECDRLEDKQRNRAGTVAAFPKGAFPSSVDALGLGRDEDPVEDAA